MRRGKQQGFTMVEAAVVVAIIGLMAAIAFPAFNALVPGFRLRACGQEVYRSIQLAREEAIKRNRKVSVEFETASCKDQDLRPWSGIGFKMYEGDKEDAPISRGVLPPLVAVCKDETSLKAANGDAKASFKANGLPTAPQSGALATGHIFLRNSSGRYLKVNLAEGGAIKVANAKP